MTEKVPRSFTIPKDVDEEMRERDDVNWSGAVRQFLNEFIASGQSTEAAIAVRLEQIRDELADARQEVERLERERDRLEATLEEKRESRRDVFDSFQSIASTFQHSKGELTPSNEAVQRHAEKLGMPPETFLAKYREWSE